MLRGGELFESFRYRFDLPLAADARTIPVTVQRFLRPGRYRLNLRLQDLVAESYFRKEIGLDVPRVAAATGPSASTVAAAVEPPAAAAPVDADPLDVDPEDVADAGREPSVRLFVPGEELLVGTVRVEAVTSGEGIARVGFSLDGRNLLTKARPPYSVAIDVGRTPQTHRLQAAALDREGEVLATDEILLNGGPYRFSVRLISPLSGQTQTESVLARAEVDVPRLEKLDRLEFYLNETLIASLYQPPFVQRILVPSEEPLAYVRAVGYLQDGGAAEDIVFVNAPDLIDRVDINFVELYATVTDRRGRPVDDVSAADLRVFEDGVEQRIVRFEPAKDLPIHACVLFDTSTSMDERMKEAEEAALHFFELVLTERDRACLMVFNDQPDLVVPFTNSTSVLAGGLSGLLAEGETALHDSLIQALFRFGGCAASAP